MAPELFKGLDPVMHSFQLLRFQVVHAVFALLAHRDHADLAQHAKVLRDSRLWKPQRYDQRSHSQGPAPRQQLDNLSPAGLGDGDEDVGCSRRTRHVSTIFPYGNVSSQDSIRAQGRAIHLANGAAELRRGLVQRAVSELLYTKHAPAGPNVKDDHRVVLTLPPEVPIGQAE